MAWQTMDNAPDDGSPVWGITMAAQRPTPRVTWFQNGRWFRVAKGEDFSPPGPHGWWPTHWQAIVTPNNP